MKKTVLGELEELALMVKASTEAVYRVLVREELQRQTGRSFTTSAVHTTLYRQSPQHSDSGR